MDSLKHAPLKITDIRSKYKVIDKVGKGTYGTVFKVLNLQDNKYYAIKKFQNTEAKLQVEGFPITALREISLLKQLNHPNIINLIEIICSKPNKRNLYRGSTFMVFQYMHHDFSGLFRAKVKFSLSQIKCMMQQILEGCNYLHQNKIMHRDIKSANILLNDQGLVQLADFGLGRRTRFDNVYTYKVVTLWYRAPQLLLGCKTYNHKVDVWSIGCVLAQFLINQVLFKKETQYALIERIYQICGDLQQNEFTQEYLRGCAYYHQMRPKKTFKNTIQSYIKKMSPNVDDITLKFLKGLLQLNPYKRPSCQQALNHQFFKTHPLPCKPSDIPQLDIQYHEMFRDRSMKIERKKQARKDSVDWSEEQQRKNKEKLQKKREPEQSQFRINPKNSYDKSYSGHQSTSDKYYHQKRHPQYKYEDKKYEHSSRKQYLPYQKSRYRQRSEEKNIYIKSKRKYSRDPSQSSSSSSSNSHSRSRNKKYNYGQKSSPSLKYSKQVSHYRSGKDRQYPIRKEQKNSYQKPKQRYQERQRSGRDTYKKDSQYYKERHTLDYKERHALDYKDWERQRISKPYSQKYYEDDKYERRQYKPRGYAQKYQSRDQPQRSYIKIQHKQQLNKIQSYSYKDKYTEKQHSRQKQIQKSKQKYIDRPYHSKESNDYQYRENKDYKYRENKDYQHRDNKDRDYSRKQYNGPQKYYDDRKYEKSKDKQFSEYDKKEYRKDYNYRKISNQNRFSPQKKRYSPYKKSMDIQKYQY